LNGAAAAAAAAAAVVCREVTALLQRKSSWVPADVARFTELYAAEHQTEQAVAAAKASYSNFSRDVEQLQLQLMNMIRERYQQVTDLARAAATITLLFCANFVAQFTFKYQLTAISSWQVHAASHVTASAVGMAKTALPTGGVLEETSVLHALK
jgi:hypothetical protein